MSRRFAEDGKSIPVTIIEAGPVVITQVKEERKDGYSAVQVGYQEKKKLTKPLAGHLKGLKNFRYLREFRLKQEDAFKRGDEISLGVFKKGDLVDVTGVSKGLGFQGVVKRHGFHGSPASHGHKDQLRMPGSIGSAFPEHVVKGKRMAGRMGNEKVTAKSLEIIEVNPEKNILAVKGALPGSRNSLLLITEASQAKEEVNREKQSQ